MPVSGPATGELSIGSSLGNYTIISFVGRGGMGAVYQGEHTFLGRRAAIKVLLPEYSENAELVDRFFKEARATALLRHRAFVEVFDSGSLPGGSAYLIMEMLDGENLAAHIERRGRLPLAEAVAIAQATAEGVGYAHRHGIIHRDLKPDNVFLARSTDSDNPGAIAIKVLDFGIAKLAKSREVVGSMTRTGAILGTPHYMAPEQCRGSGRAAIDHRADIYSLGCMMHAMLAGNAPFPFEGFGEILAAHIAQAPPPLRSLAPDVPAELEALVLRMLAKNADDRPASMEDVDGELRRLQAFLGFGTGGIAGPGEGASHRAPAAPPFAAMTSPELWGTRPPARTAVLNAAGAAPLPATTPMPMPAPTPAPGGVLPGATRRIPAVKFERSGTLTGGVGEQAPRPRARPSRAPLFAVGAVGVLALGVIGVLWLGGDRGGDKTAVTPREPAPHPAPAMPPPETPTTQRAVPEPRREEPEAPLAPQAPPAHAEAPAPAAPRAGAPHERRVTIGISSSPEGADVIDARTGGVVGTTPFEKELPFKKRDTARFAIRKEGFARREVKVRLDRDARVDVTLERAHATAPIAAQPTAPPPPARKDDGDDDDDDRRKL
jgi:serine/threonine-protein kinase